MATDDELERKAGQRVFTLPVRAHLDTLDIGTVLSICGEPDSTITKYREPERWRYGDGRPALADDDPVVMCAIGRCTAARLRGTVPSDVLAGLFQERHPDRCPWCEWPMEELLLALDWFVWHQREVLVQLVVWKGGAGDYFRDTGVRGVTNPAVRHFMEMPQHEQQHLVDTIMREVS